jgi:hypothetical protein
MSTSFDAAVALAAEWNVTPAAIVRARAEAKLRLGAEFENDERAMFLFAKGLTDVDFVDLCTTVWSSHLPRSYAKEFAAEIEEIRKAFKTSSDTVEVASARGYYPYQYFRDGTDPDSGSVWQRPKYVFMHWCLTSAHPVAGEFRGRLNEVLGKPLFAMRWQTQRGQDDTDDTTYNNDVPQDVSSSLSFASFERQHPEWSAGRSWVFFRDHPRLMDRNKREWLIQRCVTSSIWHGFANTNCSIHAAVMTHYYTSLVRAPLLSDVRPADVPSFVRQHMTNYELRCILLGGNFKNMGGLSVKRITSRLTNGRPEIPVDSADYMNWPEQGAQDSYKLLELLEKHGPALVAGFQTSSDFHNTSLWRHVGNTRQPLTFSQDGPHAGHAMVLVGVRTDEQTGTKRVLLQNWWRDKQFVECDGEYLRASGAQLVFVTGAPLYKSPSQSLQLVMTDAKFAQSALDIYDVSGSPYSGP